MTHTAQVFFALVVLFTVQIASADHALLDDGRVLYNVMIPEGATTGTALTRIRTGSSSFGYDPKTDSVFLLQGYSSVHRLADYISTYTTVGREQATEIAQKRKWNRYSAPADRQTLVAPPPSPKATPPPVGLAAKPPESLNVVPDSVPLDDRLTRQMDMFMSEQTTLAQDATTSVAQGLASPEKATEEKVRLLRQQKSILEQFYPQTTDTVRLAVDYWGQQVDRATETGRFDLENL